MTRDWLNLSWRLLVMRGILAVLFGIAIMVWPDVAILTFIVLWGIWALIEGIGALVQAFEPGTPGSARALLVLMGLIALVVAFFALFSPGVTAKALTWILGIWLLIRAVFEVVGAFSASQATPRWLILLSAALDLVLGILFVTNPGASAMGIAWVLGLVTVVWGVVFLVTGFLVRKEASSAPPDALASPA